MSAPPLPCQWDGEAFKPAGAHWSRLADKHFTVGEVYRLEVHEERSAISHRHFFASINEAWSNLPEHLAERFGSPDHLRRYALIRTGYRDERSIACASPDEARRVAAFVKPMDEFAVVVAEETVVSVYTAKSQSMRSMGKREFQDSKDKVLDFIASLIGTTTKALEQHASEAA